MLHFSHKPYAMYTHLEMLKDKERSRVRCANLIQLLMGSKMAHLNIANTHQCQLLTLGSKTKGGKNKGYCL